MIYLISLIVAIICLIVIAVIVIKKFPRLVIIDVETMMKEKEAKIKEKIIWQRIARKSRERGAPMIRAWEEAKKKVDAFFKKTKERARKLENKYKTEQRIGKPSKLKPATEGKTKSLLETANDLMAQEKFAEAEGKLIEAVGLDHQNIEAYWGLAQIYFKTKQLDQAKETLDFIIKLRKDDDKTYAMQGEIAFLEGKYDDAKEYLLIALARNAAVVNYYINLAKVYSALNSHEEAQGTLLSAKDIEPKNPKILDFLLENSIILANKELAEKTFEEFKLLNPDNPKLQEWRKKIDELK